MISSFELCVRAVVETILEDDGGADPAVCAKVGDFILATWSRMPDHIRAALFLATIMFDVAPIARSASRFQRLDPRSRRNQLQRWQHARLNAMRSLPAFYRSLAVFARSSFQSDPGPSSNEIAGSLERLAGR